MTLLFVVILVALVFEYINGFHDTANSIATVVSTKVLTPRLAILLAAVTNLGGALWGNAVAKSITSGLVHIEFVTTQTIICALLAGIVWNLLTWWFGIPSSSTHALVGGLVGATLGFHLGSLLSFNISATDYIYGAQFEKDGYTTSATNQNDILLGFGLGVPLGGKPKQVAGAGGSTGQ